jgi:hypothetical protein
MPKITTIKVSPFDSVQGIPEDRTLPITRSIGSDLERAINEDHYCEDSTCDIHHALEAGAPVTAACLLMGATECAHVDAVRWAHAFNGTSNEAARTMHMMAAPDWDRWLAYHDRYGMTCDACGTVTYRDDTWTPEDCGACGATFEAPADLDAVLDAYVACALWSSTDESTPEGGEPMDANYTRSDIAPDALESMREDVESFLSDADIRRALEFWAREHGDAQIGHDFWLTRNRHGAGFWDRWGSDTPGYAHGRALTDAAHPYGESYLYIGDDGKVYVA